MKLIAIILLGLTGSIIAQQSEKPTIEQLRNSRTVKISLECSREDDDKTNLDVWQNITVMVDELIDLCYSTSSDEKNDGLLLEEIGKTIKLIRQEQRKDPNGIHGLITVSVGSPSEEK